MCRAGFTRAYGVSNDRVTKAMKMVKVGAMRVVYANTDSRTL